MYQALYRKWRPRVFDDVVGQEHITETLKNQVRSDRLSHAYLFIGTRGTGKTTCAKILAKAVNCEQPVNGNPCNCCPTCRGIDDGTILDVVEMDAASNNSVDDVRLLRDEAIYSPAGAKKRVYIVDEVHMLSKPAFNALLKILEEPPAHLMFILATTELHKVPATILSRCQRHSFKRITPDKIAARLMYVAGQEHIALEPEAAQLLARLADGGMRDALTLLDQCGGMERVTSETVLSAMGMAGHFQTVKLLEHVAAQDTSAALAQFRALWQEGKDPATVLDELASLQRDALMRAVAARGSAALLSGGYDDETLDGFVQAFGAAGLLANLNQIQATRAAMSQSVDARLSAELCLIRLCRPELQGDLLSLSARVAALEAGAPRQAKAENTPAPKAEAPKPKAKEPEPVRADDPPPWDEDLIPPPPPWDERTYTPPPMPQEERRFTPPPLPKEEPKFTPPPLPKEEPVFTPPPLPKEEPVFTPSPLPKEEPAPARAVRWEEICKAAQSLMNPGQYSMLHNAALVRGHMENGVLTVEMDRSLAYMMLGTPEVAATLKKAAEPLTGGSVQVRIEPMESTEPTQLRSLEELSRFGNVEFK
ncbi:MAG: DNA polymerase III subunit gamma/tau [Oscillospiraceae bacterium]|nr:DNA polymerase III subunit gamma/tau [Oscillospiraceae bacterium]